MQPTIRDVTDDELDTVLGINESVVPAVNSLSPGQMGWFRLHAHYFRVVDIGDEVGAFLIGLRPGLDYASLNYRWFVANYRDFAYVDRVAVDERARRAGLASRLYADFEQTLPADVTTMTCEVNIRPPNETSMRFHERQGFRRVGTQKTDDGQKEVALLAKNLGRKRSHGH